MTCPVLTYRDPSTKELTCLQDHRAIWLWGDFIAPDSDAEWAIFTAPALLWISLVLLATTVIVFSRTSYLFALFPSPLRRLALSSALEPYLSALDLTRSYEELTTSRQSRLACLDKFRVGAMLWVFCNHIGSEGRVDILERLPSAVPFKRQWTSYVVRRSLRLWLCLFAFVNIALSPLLRYVLPRFYATMVNACGWQGVLGHLTFRSNHQEQPTCLGYLCKWRRVGLVAIASLVAYSMWLRGTHCIAHHTCNKSDVDIPFIHIASLSEAEIKATYRGLWSMYASIFTKAGPFLLAIVLGVWEAEGITVSKRHSNALFYGGFAGALGTIFAIIPQYKYPEMETNLYNVIYTATFRTVFAFCILCVIASMALVEKPTPVSRMYSTLAKLCFSAYLLHMPLVYLFNYVPAFQETTSAYALPIALVVHGPLTFAVAFVFHLFVEAPTGRLASLLAKRIMPFCFALTNPITEFLCTLFAKVRLEFA